MKTSKDFNNSVANLKGDVETAIAKFILKNNIKKVDYKGSVFDIRIGDNQNGAKCVFLCDMPLMTYTLEDSIEVLEYCEQTTL